tara:strand:+ start:225 stop:389 length:165 start_codon:yes stop_codon:yes gene_type:complete
MFTTRHYKAIASIIATLQIPKKHKLKLINNFVTLFKGDNKNFKDNNFKKACGGE